MKRNSKRTAKIYDYLIIGAGPAGLQMAYFLEKAGRSYLVLEGGDSAGTFFKRFPRHRQLISINKVFTGYEDAEINLRWDWNSLLSDSEQMLFKHYSKKYFPNADDLVKYLSDYATHYRLNVEYGAKVARIKRMDLFVAETKDGREFQGKRLIVAAGLTKSYTPAIKGIELAETYSEVSVDPKDYINQRVLIIGKGNSGFETADNLTETTSLIHIASPSPINLAWKTKFVGHLRAVNNNFLDTYQLKSQNAMLDATVEKIERNNGKLLVTFDYTHAEGEREELAYDRVILCTGFRFDDLIFDQSCKPAMAINNRFPDQTSEWESTNVRDMYFAGTLMQMRDYKKKQSAFIHGFRYNIKALYQLLEKKYYAKPLPALEIDLTPDSLMEAILNRINVTSALWQQTGFICDLIVIRETDAKANYFEDLPADYVHESDLGEHEHYYTITLEFGHEVINRSPDPLTISRINKENFDAAERSAVIHPVVRRFSRGKQVSMHHIIEDLASVWIEDVHTQPLLKYLAANIEDSPRRPSLAHPLQTVEA